MGLDVFLSGPGGIAVTVVVFLVAISIIVAVHEYGHYIVGRWTGIHAEVFSLGFGPVLGSRTDKRGTKWQIAAFPLGGYVKFMGDADAASVRSGALEGYSDAERRRTMAGAPIWARSLTVAAGPVANFILGFLIILTFVLTIGLPADQPVVGTVRATNYVGDSLQPGDKILAMQGIATPTTDAYETTIEKLPLSTTITWTVERNGTKMDVNAQHPSPVMIGQVLPKSAAGDAGLRQGDIILSANGQTVSVFAELPKIVKALDGKSVTLKIWRDGTEFEATMSPRRRDIPLPEGGFEKRWLVGLGSGSLIDLQTRTPGIWEAVTTSADSTWNLLVTSLSGLWHILTGMISTCNLSGPIGMAEVMGEAALAGPQAFFERLAIFSLGIGLLNLFPIPVLDGGHLVFHAYEAVTGRPPNDKALRVMMSVGLTLLLGLMVFALSNDIFCV
jgi:regulator of sigma E protease